MKCVVAFADGKKIPLSWGEQNEAAWQAILKRNHPRPAHCICSNKRLPLAIRHREARVGQRIESRYHLAVYPGTGPSHHPGCQLHRVEPHRTGASSYTTGVLMELEDGTVQVRLTPPLSGQPNQGQTMAASQRFMTPLGLLHLLWERSDLNFWHGGKSTRGWRWVADVLRDASNSVRVSAHRATPILLSDHLLVLQAEKDETRRGVQTALNRALLERVAVRGGRIVIIGELKEASEYENDDAKLIFYGAAGLKLNVWLKRRRSELLRRFPVAARVLAAPEEGSGRSRCICIAVADLEGDPGSIMRADARDCALMAVNGVFLPFASKLERLVADELVKERRVLRKPLRYDAGDIVLPDFELLDTLNSPLPMEVFGIDTIDYRSRMEEKKTFYDLHYGKNVWWYWDAVGRGNQVLPPFPPRAGG